MSKSVAVLALMRAKRLLSLSSAALGLVVALSGCASTAPTSKTTIDRHVVPNAIVQVSLEDFDVVSFIDIDLHTAVQTREAVESEFNSAYGKTGHPRWFFHAFDQKNLDFVVARFEPKDAKKPRYVAERRLRVKRTAEAERALGVTYVVHEYEVGTRGIKAGMTRREVLRVAGRPEAERSTSPVPVPAPAPAASPSPPKGTFEMRYPAFCVRFVDNKVAHVLRRDQCTI